MPITLRVNGRSHTVDADPQTPLLYVLRNDLQLNGPKFGCGLGQCGACTVLLGKSAVRSCILPLSAAKSAEITTLEGLGTPEQPDPIQRAFIEHQAIQCGYCNNGMMMTAKGLLNVNPTPTDAEIRQALNHNLCRCGTHVQILEAIRAVAGGKRA
jgi:nicotinate dehydrogenase subunit A